MRLSVAHVVVAAGVWAPLAAALFVSPDSPCATYCGNVLSRTATDEMACNSTALSGTAAGAVWEQCIRCLLNSTYESGSRSDVQALTYNLRFNMETCLFNAPTEPCITSRACGPLAGAVDYQNMSTSVGAYDYCGTWSADTVSKCSLCLVELQDGNYLNNYMTILEAACEQRPANGSTVSIQGDPFSTNAVLIVTPQPTYATVPTPDYGPVSLGARVGIAFGGLALILAVAGFCIVCIGKRRRRAFLRDLERKHGANGWPHPTTRYGGGNGQDMFETPVSQKPLRGWESESPVSAATDGPYPRYFSPYSSTYNSPISGPQHQQGASGSTPASATAGPGHHHHNWPAFPSQQQLDELLMTQALSQPQSQSPATHYGGSAAPAFSQWPTASQEKTLLQMHAHHEKRQRELAIGLALGGDDASLRSKASHGNLNANGYPVDVKGKGRGDGGGHDSGVEGEAGEGYEMHVVESPYDGGGGGGGQEHYQMPAPPQAPVLHHPGYGRHHRSERSGSSGTGGSTG